jgi:hypothetical protein
MDRIVLIVPSCARRAEEACRAIVSLDAGLEPVVVPSLIRAWFLLKGFAEHVGLDTDHWRVACRSALIVGVIVDDNAQVPFDSALPETEPDGREVTVYWGHPVSYDAHWCLVPFIRCRQAPQQFAALRVFTTMGSLLDANPLPDNWQDAGPSMPEAAQHLRDRITAAAA